ncbi:MAG: hypothetical protein ACPLPR_02235 [Bacillota bacterium]
MVRIRYIGGHPTFKGPCEVTVRKVGDKIEFRVGNRTLIIAQESFCGADFTRGEKRSLGKAAFGALAGMAIGGPVGGIIGAAVGARAKQANTFTIPVVQGQLSYSMIFEGTERDFNNLISEIYG